MVRTHPSNSRRSFELRVKPGLVPPRLFLGGQCLISCQQTFCWDYAGVKKCNKMLVL